MAEDPKSEPLPDETVIETDDEKDDIDDEIIVTHLWFKQVSNAIVELKKKKKLKDLMVYAVGG